jgi:hypothetical protein
MLSMIYDKKLYVIKVFLSLLFTVKKIRFFVAIYRIYYERILYRDKINE